MNVFSVSRYIVYVIEPQLILDGSAGSVFAMQPLISNSDSPSAVYNHLLVAFCTQKKVSPVNWVN